MLVTNKDFLIIRERHPLIAQKIEWAWGDQVFYKFFDNSMNDTRGGTRKGFSEEVSNSLLNLYIKHSTEYPRISTEADIWSNDSKWGAY